jgi:hypothetical protein
MKSKPKKGVAGSQSVAGSNEDDQNPDSEEQAMQHTTTQQ